MGETGSIDECVAERIRLHYQRINLSQGWDRSQFYELCKLIHCTEQELAALVNMKKATLSRCLRENKFSTEASLHFALLEATFRRSTRSIIPLELLAKESTMRKPEG